jgi:hypothetical protein
MKIEPQVYRTTHQEGRDIEETQIPPTANDKRRIMDSSNRKTTTNRPKADKASRQAHARADGPDQIQSAEVIEMAKQDSTNQVKTTTTKTKTDDEESRWTVFPLFFLRTMESTASDTLHSWMLTSAPAEIRELWRAMGTFQVAQRDPTSADASDYMRALRDLAIGRKYVSRDAEWPLFSTHQRDDAQYEKRCAEALGKRAR